MGIGLAKPQTYCRSTSPGGTILQTEPPTTTSTFRYTENHIFEIEQKIEQLQQKIDSQKEDILNTLKARVNNFTLD